MNKEAGVDLRGLARAVVTTSVCNVIGVAASGFAGLIVARALGPTVRGEYAAIFAWFGFALILGEIGQTAATTYFVAEDVDHAADYLASSRQLMVMTGSVMLVVGMLVTPFLAAGGAEVASGYRLMFATCMLCFVGASYIFSLQAVNTAQWNLVRLSQPVMFLLAVVLIFGSGHLGLLAVLGAAAGTMAAQSVLAYACCRRRGITGGRPQGVLRRRLVRYGLSQVAASVPGTVILRLDQLVLSLTVAPAVLGHYAVATSVTALALPVVAAVGYIIFPRFASRSLSHVGERRVQRWALLCTFGAGVGLLLPISCLSPWLIPRVFGADYRDAVLLTMLLAPAGLFQACGQVCGDLLRGYGRPLSVARAQIVGAIVTIALLSIVVPLFGAVGAAMAASTARAVPLLLMLRGLRRQGGVRTHTPRVVSASG